MGSLQFLSSFGHHVTHRWNHVIRRDDHVTPLVYTVIALPEFTCNYQVFIIPIYSSSLLSSPKAPTLRYVKDSSQTSLNA